MRDRPLTFPLIELLPGLLGAVVGCVVGRSVTGAIIGFLAGLAFVTLMHWVSRLSVRKPPPVPVAPTVPDETVWPPPPKIG